MAFRSRKYRLVIVPCLCVALLTWQFFVRGDAYASQIDHIEVNRTVSKFVAPMSRISLTKLQGMSYFASLVAPISELPERNWLLEDSTQDDSDVLELATHLVEAAIGDTEGGEADADASESLIKAAKELLKAAARSLEALEAYHNEGIFGKLRALNRYREAQKTLENFKATLNEHVKEVAEVTNEVVERARELLDLAQAEANQAAQEASALQFAEAVAETDETAHEEALQYVEEAGEQVGGAYYDPSRSWEGLVKNRRQMMLEFELDAVVLASM